MQSRLFLLFLLGWSAISCDSFSNLEDIQTPPYEAEFAFPLVNSSIAVQDVLEELDNLAVRTAASHIAEEPNYSKLAARLLAVVIDEEVARLGIACFSDSIKVGLDPYPPCLAQWSRPRPGRPQVGEFYFLCRKSKPAAGQRPDYDSRTPAGWAAVFDSFQHPGV